MLHVKEHEDFAD